ncbi:MAG: hypothetical protein P8H59_05070 [Flavobacteriales bacterium]|nr:hypothetical protein [Flavobacteriales bacterium]
MKTPLLLVIAVILSLGVTSCRKVYFSDGKQVEEYREIEVQINQSGSFIIIEASWAEEVSFLKKGMYGIKRSFGSGQRVKVDLTIWLPDGLDIEVLNKFGDVYFTNYTGELDVEVSHGDLRANNLPNPNRIKVEYGKVKLGQIGNGKLDISYSESVRIDEAQDIFIKSNSSDIEIEDVLSLQLDSRNDDLRIEKAGKVTGTTFLTDIRLQELATSMDVNCRMGELRMRSINASCRSLKIRSSGTDLMLDFALDFQGSFDVDLENVRDWSCVITGLVITDENVDDHDRTMLATKEENTGNTVQLTVKNAAVRIGG